VDTSHIRYVHGVDFSGAEDAGKSIWIATGIIKGKTLEIGEIRPAKELPASGRKREQSLSALVDFISREREAIIGMDFPFGLPAPLVKEDSWESFVLSFNQRFSDPEGFKEKCFSAANKKELRRTTDDEQRTPFSPYNLWLYKQTYYGIGYVIKPLMQQRQASFLPMQKPITELSWVIEICPASTLKNRGFDFRYKGRSPDRRAQRLQILKGIKEFLNVKISQDLETKIMDDSGGDALDSVIAAFATFHNLPNLFSPPVTGNSIYTLEGYVYA
jgi:hypothetical protein